MSSRLKDKYESEVAPRLKEEFGIKNPMATPKIIKVVVNMGVGEMTKNKEIGPSLSRDLAMVTGQKPSTRLAKVSIATFGLRRGMPVGLSVTLRGVRMYDFLDKLFSIVLPRLRDFRGASSKSFDMEGNYTLGLPEHTVFPEVDVAKAGSPHGLEISIVTNAASPERAKRLLYLLGMPFEKEQ
ncbi:50S ribosomal protein L5 [Candidatus Woesebacteria bacterium]|nr:50S ribosomal protein L5 [Candidatus Woesebacteria bacterium]